MSRIRMSSSSVSSCIVAMTFALLVAGVGCFLQSGSPSDNGDDSTDASGVTDSTNGDDNGSGSGSCPETELDSSADFATLNQQQYATLCSELQEAGSCSSGNGSVTVSPPENCETWSQNFADWSTDDSQCGATVGDFLDCQCNCNQSCQSALACSDEVRDSADAGTGGDTTDASNQDAG